eukprot:714720-Prymnesium_polylepis.1
MFEARSGIIIYDEAVTTCGYVKKCGPTETVTFPDPDVAFDRLQRMGARASVIFSDADGLCSGVLSAFAARVAPQKRLRFI